MMVRKDGRAIIMEMDVDTGVQKWSTRYGRDCTGEKRPLHDPMQQYVCVRRSRSPEIDEERAQQIVEQKVADDERGADSHNTVRKSARILLNEDELVDDGFRQEVDDVKNDLFSHWLRMRTGEWRLNDKLAAANEAKELSEMALAEQEQKVEETLEAIMKAEALAWRLVAALEAAEIEGDNRLTRLNWLARMSEPHPYVDIGVHYPDAAASTLRAPSGSVGDAILSTWN